jgi:imidazolonepropionase-like amidohydrolase
MRLSGWTREDMALQRPAALDVTWPSMALQRGPDAKPSLEDQQKAIAAALEEMDDIVVRSRAYHDGRAAAGAIPPLAYDLRLEAMKPALDGTIPVVVHAETVPQMRAALAWGKRHGLRLILEGARDAWQMAGEIAAAKVPVIIGAVRALPDHDFDAYDTRWERPVLLHRAGVKVMFNAGSNAGNSWAVRNLPEEAAMTIPWGMPPEEALRAITLSPAEAYGVGDRIGSVEAGKLGDVVVWDGPPLEITSHAIHLFMRGAEIPIADRHTRLYERYKARPR